MFFAKTPTRFNPRSIRFRLTIFFVSFLAFTLVTFSTILYRNFVEDQRGEFDSALFNYATDISRNIDISFFGSLSIERDILFDRQKLFPFTVGQSLLQVVNRHGQILARSRSLTNQRLPFTSDDVFQVSRFQSSFKTIPNPLAKQSKEKFRVVAYPLGRANPADLILQVAVPQVMLEEQTGRLLHFFLISIPLTLILVAMAGYYLSGTALAPVSALINKARQLSASRLSERLPVPPADDELRMLSTTLNDLLDRLQMAFETQDRFIADASHQLKTPLAIMRGELDVFSSKPRAPGEMNQFVASASQELEHLSQMVDNLLVLTRVDAGRDNFEFHPVRVDEIAVEAVARLERFAKRHGIQIRLDLVDATRSELAGAFEIKGDPDLLRTMLQALMENAIKYSNEKNIEVRLVRQPNTIVMEVLNWGEPIPPDQLEKIFERFYRKETGAPGLGIGLAIVKRIAEAHGGHVRAESSALSGTRFTVEIKNI